CPLPTILPSYNQIGFDSLHYLVTVLEGDEHHAIAWASGAKLVGEENRTVIDPEGRAFFPLELTAKDGLITLVNRAGFNLEVLTAHITFEEFRIAGRLGSEADAVSSAGLYAKTECGTIAVYGPLLRMLGICNPETDILAAFGGANLRRHEGG